MRHRKHTFKLGRTGSHRRAMIANMLKSLIMHKRIETTVVKAKEIRRFADKLVTLAKRDTLDAKRKASSLMRLSHNPLTSKEKRKSKAGDLSYYNDDRKILQMLFGELKDKFLDRNGGYTRVIRKDVQQGDSAEKCYLEYL